MEAMKFLFFVFSVYLVTFTVAEKLRVNLYYESLCPYCRHFIKEQLWPGYQKLGDFLDVTFVPYGNAITKKYENGTYVVTCQHGQNECEGNIIEGCALKIDADAKKVINFVHCVEKNEEPWKLEEAKKCAETAEIPWDPIKECATSEKGHDILVEMGEISQKVHPPYEGVPTITFNGTFNNQTLSYAAITDFLGTACSLFKEKPSICDSRKNYLISRSNATVNVLNF